MQNNVDIEPPNENEINEEAKATENENKDGEFAVVDLLREQFLQ